MCLYFNHNNSNNANLYFTTGGLLYRQGMNRQMGGILVCDNLEVQQFSHRYR